MKLREKFDAWCLAKVRNHHAERLWEAAEILIKLGHCEHINGDAQPHINRAKDEIYSARLKLKYPLDQKSQGAKAEP